MLIDGAAEKWMEFVSVGMRLKKPRRNRTASAHNAKISERQYRILATLAFFKMNTISDIARHMHLSKSTLSIIMSKLIKAGYVTRTEPDDGEDKRRVFFKVTNSAIEIIRIKNEENINCLRDFYYSISEQQRETFRRGVSLLKFENGTDVQCIESVVQKVLHSFEDESDFTEVIDDLSYFLIGIVERSKKAYGSSICEDAAEAENFCGITVHQIHLLFCICEMGLNTIKKLEEFLGSSGSTLSITVSKLVDKGFLEKAYPPSGEDGRTVYIIPTPKAETFFNKAGSLAVKMIKRTLLENFTNDELVRFNTGLDCIISVFKTA